MYHALMRKVLRIKIFLSSYSLQKFQFKHRKTVDQKKGKYLRLQNNDPSLSQ